MIRILTLILFSQILILEVQAQISCPEKLNPSDLTDQHRSSSLSGNGAWKYSRSYSNSDLNGDGEKEIIHLLADVEMIDGEPAWDDGQPWEIVIEEQNGEKTSVFLDYVQLGSVEIDLINRESVQELLLIVRQGADIKILTISYNHPNEFFGCKQFVGIVDTYSKNWKQN